MVHYLPGHVWVPYVPTALNVTIESSSVMINRVAAIITGSEREVQALHVYLDLLDMQDRHNITCSSNFGTDDPL